MNNVQYVFCFFLQLQDKMSVTAAYSKEVGCAVGKHTVEGGTVYIN